MRHTHTAGGVPFLQGLLVAIGSVCCGQWLNKEAGMMQTDKETTLEMSTKCDKEKIIHFLSKYRLNYQ